MLRSFGKFFGLAGLRLGFIVAAPPLAAANSRADRRVAGVERCPRRRARRVRRPALDESRARDPAESRRSDSIDLLTLSGFELAGGTSLFRLARAADARERFARLLAAESWRRPFDFDPTLLRFGLPRGRDQWRRLAAALGTRA